MGEWLAIGCVVVIALAFAAHTVIRYNQLAMITAVCDESYRLLEQDISARHTLVPAFAEAVAGLLPGHPVVEELGDAFAAARGARTPAEAGPAETRLTGAIDQAATGIHASGTGRPDDRTSAELLSGQLISVEARMAAAVRYYNVNARRYRARRKGLVPGLFRRTFPPVAEIEYTRLASAPNEMPRITLDTTAEGTLEDYRPGRIGEQA